MTTPTPDFSALITRTERDIASHPERTRDFIYSACAFAHSIGLAAGDAKLRALQAENERLRNALDAALGKGGQV